MFIIATTETYAKSVANLHLFCFFQASFSFTMTLFSRYILFHQRVAKRAKTPGNREDHKSFPVLVDIPPNRLARQVSEIFSFPLPGLLNSQYAGRIRRQHIPSQRPDRRTLGEYVSTNILFFVL
jgi:hypothetical protein